MNNLIQHYNQQHLSRADSSNIKRVNGYWLVSRHSGFDVQQADINPRLRKIIVSKAVAQVFFDKVKTISVTDLEYVAANRFFLAHNLNQLTDNELGQVVNGILKDRNTGAFVFEVEGFNLDVAVNFDQMLKMATALSFLFGKANLDAMSGLYYARFAVEAKDSSDSYLRKFGERMSLHNDGAFVQELTDYVLMSKLAERDVVGGHSLLLHLDDWEDLSYFSQHRLAEKSFKFSAPPSKRINYSVHHPIFRRDAQGRPIMSYIDQFIKPELPEEGEYVHALGQSLESSQSVIGYEMAPGSLVVCNNRFWLHGRDKFEAQPGLYRELMRQRGTFFENLNDSLLPDSVERF